MPQRKNRLKRRRALIGYSFIVPWMVGALILFAFPMVYSLILTFGRLENIRTFSLRFAGLANLKQIFFEDVNFVPYYMQSIGDALVNLVLILSFSLFIAVLINRKIVLRGFFRSVFFLPVILGSGFVMEQLLGENVQRQSISVVQNLLLSQDFAASLPSQLVAGVQDFLGRITVVLWSSGVQIVLFLGGLQGISATIYEAARVDAAGEWEQFWLITIPLMAPTILLNAVYTVVDSFTNSSNKALGYILQRAFTDGKFETSAAMGWVYFLTIFAITLLIFALLRNAMRNATE